MPAIDVNSRVEPGTLEIFPLLPRWDFTSIETIRTDVRGGRRTAGAAGPAGPADRRGRGGADGRPDVRVRWYRPRTPTVRPLPCLVWLHGGGYIMGNLDENDGRLDRMVVELGCAVVSVDWRLAPEHPYPAGLDDAETVWTRVGEDAAALGVDPARLVVGGASAGAGLAAALCLRLRDLGRSQPALQLLVYPMLDDREVTASIRAIGRTPATPACGASGPSDWPGRPISGRSPVPTTSRRRRRRRAPRTSAAWPPRSSGSATSTRTSTRTPTTPSACPVPACRRSCTSTPGSSTPASAPRRAPPGWPQFLRDIYPAPSARRLRAARAARPPRPAVPAAGGASAPGHPLGGGARAAWGAGRGRAASYPPGVPPVQDRAPQSGTQTLARGLNALLAVVESSTGLTVQELARVLDVHRSIAYRILQTLADYGFVHAGRDGRYHAGARLAALSHSYLPGLRASAQPVMQELADRMGASVALFVNEGEAAVAIQMAVPMTVGHHIAFRQGERAPLDRGAAAYALRAALPPPAPGDPEPVLRVRELGYAYSHDEVEAGAHAIAAPIRGVHPHACLR